jgi:hypothetical protein
MPLRRFQLIIRMIASAGPLVLPSNSLRLKVNSRTKSLDIFTVFLIRSTMVDDSRIRSLPMSSLNLVDFEPKCNRNTLLGMSSLTVESYLPMVMLFKVSKASPLPYLLLRPIYPRLLAVLFTERFYPMVPLWPMGRLSMV